MAVLHSTETVWENDKASLVYYHHIKQSQNNLQDSPSWGEAAAAFRFACDNNSTHFKKTYGKEII